MSFVWTSPDVRDCFVRMGNVVHAYLGEFDSDAWWLHELAELFYHLLSTLKIRTRRISGRRISMILGSGILEILLPALIDLYF